MSDKKTERKTGVSRTRSQPVRSKNEHKNSFNALLDDAILGVKKKKQAG